MRAVVQRVSSSTLKIEGNVYSEIQKGFLILLGVEESDTSEDLQWLISKIIGLRIMDDGQGKMNLSLADTEASILLVSQFTLFASTKKGNRPSFIRAAKSEIANAMYERAIDLFKQNLGKDKVKTGVFGADMKIDLCNDGPVTIIIDSKNKE